MHSLIFVYLINWILLSGATVCESFYADQAFHYMQSDDNGGGVQYLVEPEFDDDCISVSYSIYDIHNNNNNTIVFYSNDNSFVCQDYCYPILDCANIIDGKINMYYYTSFNESFSYSQVVEYDECHMDDGDIFLTIILSVIFGGGLIVFMIIWIGIWLSPNPQENTEENPQEKPEKETENTTLENTDDDSNMVELDLSI